MNRENILACRERIIELKVQRLSALKRDRPEMDLGELATLEQAIFTLRERQYRYEARLKEIDDLRAMAVERRQQAQEQRARIQQRRGLLDREQK